jgi:two-component system response regulator RegX3
MRRILLVEDEEILRDTYTTIISTQPYILDCAANGKEALENYQQHSYDLILLDVMMPVMDGVAFLEKIQDLDIERPKILLLTNLSSGSDIEKALKLGADKAILKANLSPRELLATIRYEVEAT